MPNDLVQEFHALRSSLVTERDRIQKRLEQIDSALSGNQVDSPRSSPQRVSTKLSERRSMNGARGRGRPPRSGNGLSIREAITKVTSQQPLGLTDIVNAVQKIGYRFVSSNPRNSVGAFLYSKHGKKYFKNVDGKFASLDSVKAPAIQPKNTAATVGKLKKK